MATTLTIDSSPLAQPGMDFQAIRQEAMQYAQALSGHVWSDYNTHDPGLTILDQLCYALTDLSYRIDYEIEDLMARADGRGQAGMFSPRSILPARPTTLADYRKVMLDVPGVRNAWIEKASFPVPKVFRYSEDNTFRVEEADGGERVEIKGLYRALVELEPGYPDTRDTVVAEVRRRLLAERNLCEDFLDVRALPSQPVRVVTDIELGHVEDLPQLAAEIFAKVAAFISPQLRFYTLQEMLAKGYRIDEVFEGPRLNHGFLDDREVGAYQRRKEIRSSDLIQVIMDIPGITAVRSIHLKTSTGKVEKWLLPLDPNKAPELDLIESKVTFLKEDLHAGVYTPAAMVGRAGATEPRELPSPWELDLQPSPRRHRNIANYHSIQHHFPAAFGLGPLGLAGNPSPRRQAQVHQLRAYLLLFEQILANQFQQASEAASLFSFTETNARTYFSQHLIDSVPEADIVLNPEEPVHVLRALENGEWCFTPGERSPEVGAEIVISGPYLEVSPVLVLEAAPDLVRVAMPEGQHPPAGPHTWRYTRTHLVRQLESITESEAQALARKNKFLNHIMARFGEQLTEYSLLLHQLETGENGAAHRAMVDKLNFLRDYEAVSRDRGGAFDYGKPSQPDNVAGMARRVQRMLGMEAEESIHLVEHILLRPRTADELSGLHVLYVEKKILDFHSHPETPGGYVCTCPEHGLKEGEEILLRRKGDPELLLMAKHITPNTFVLVLKNPPRDDGAPYHFLRKVYAPDPYSLQLTAMVPAWPRRMQDENFRKLVEKTIRTEAPAHLKVYIQWVDQDRMAEFEHCHFVWLSELSKPL